MFPTNYVKLKHKQRTPRYRFSYKLLYLIPSITLVHNDTVRLAHMAPL